MNFIAFSKKLGLYALVGVVTSGALIGLKELSNGTSLNPDYLKAQIIGPNPTDGYRCPEVKDLACFQDSSGNLRTFYNTCFGEHAAEGGYTEVRPGACEENLDSSTLNIDPNASTGNQVPDVDTEAFVERAEEMLESQQAVYERSGREIMELHTLGSSGSSAASIEAFESEIENLLNDAEAILKEVRSTGIADQKEHVDVFFGLMRQSNQALKGLRTSLSQQRYAESELMPTSSESFLPMRGEKTPVNAEINRPRPKLEFMLDSGDSNEPSSDSEASDLRASRSDVPTDNSTDSLEKLVKRKIESLDSGELAAFIVRHVQPSVIRVFLEMQPKDMSPEMKSGRFEDVPTDAWYRSAADLAEEKGWIKGDKGRFNAEGRLDASQLVTVVARLLELNSSALPSSATRVAVADWSKNSLAALETKLGADLLNEILGNMRLGQPVTRIQVAMLLNASLDLPKSTVASAFTDLSGLSAAQLEAVYAVSQAEIMGVDSKKFEPNSYLNRAQLAAMLERAERYLNN